MIINTGRGSLIDTKNLFQNRGVMHDEQPIS